MKYVACLFLAAFFAPVALGAIPTTPEGWYTPDVWQPYTLMAHWTNERTGETYGCDIENGEIIWYEGKIDKLLKMALGGAVRANDDINAIQQQFEHLGKHLYDLTSKSGIRITNPNTGQSYTINFGGSLAAASSAASGEIPATSTEKDPLDHLSLGWTSNGKYQLKDWDETASTPLTPLANAIKKRPADKTVFDDYKLVVRNSSFGLDYVPLGTLDVGGAAVDGATITTNTAEGAAMQGALSLYGWSAANGGASGTAPVLPYADGGGNLAWQGVLDFFNTGLFDMTESGKVNLKGVSAGDDDLRVLTVSAGDGGAAITSSSISGMIALPLAMDDANKIAVNGYAEADVGAVAYKTAEGLEWRVPEDVTLVDGSSITTNSTDGASESGVASLRGWSDAEADDFPRKGSDGHLEWKSPDELVDGTSLAWATVDGGKKFEVKDAHLYAGNHSKHYFGTGNDAAATLGWHELPNVTTNRVEGDNITIASSASASDAGLKKFSLLGWNSGWRGDPLFVVNNGGAIDYVPMSIPSNSVCACSNSWDSLAGWVGDSASFAGGSLSLPEESLDLYLRDMLGYIYSTTPDDLRFDNDGDNIQASFTAPENWADDSSLELSSSGKYQLKRWGVGGGCSANIYNMLTNSAANCADKAAHEILCRYANGGETNLHWLSFNTGRLDVDSSGWTGSFSYVDGVIQSGCVIVGRTPLRVAGFAATDGEYRVRVTLGTSAPPTAVLEQGSGFTAPSGDTSYIPVFVLSGGRITADYRGSFVVPAWDY